MKPEDIRENQIVYWWWKSGICRGIVMAIADNRAVIHHIQRVEMGMLRPVPEAPSVMFLPPEDLHPMAHEVQPPT